MANGFQPAKGGSADAFVAKLNPNGTALAYSTYFGGSGIDAGTAIAVDSNGSAYVTGFTGSNDLPTDQAVQSTFSGGSFDGFVAKLSQNGTALNYSTYLGGNGIDSVFGIAVDSGGNPSVMGVTDSLNFPLSNAWQPAFNGGAADLFIARFIPTTTPTPTPTPTPTAAPVQPPIPPGPIGLQSAAPFQVSSAYKAASGALVSGAGGVQFSYSAADNRYTITLPGHEAGLPRVRMKHGIASGVAGLVLLGAGVWLGRR